MTQIGMQQFHLLSNVEYERESLRARQPRWPAVNAHAGYRYIVCPSRVTSPDR